MNLIEGFLKDELFIDFGSEIMYGEDQVYDTYPCRFATVGFQLMSTNGLCQIADRIRKDAGFVPLHPLDEYTEDTCDQEGWYDFYIGLNDYDDGRLDSCIDFVVVNSDSLDNEDKYSIDLDEYERLWIYASLDEQCRKYLGKGCAELLREAREKMEELYYKGFKDCSFMPETISGSSDTEDEGEDEE